MRRGLLLAALPAFAASLLVLHLAGVSPLLWAVQLGGFGLVALLALLGPRRGLPPVAVVLLAFAALSLPLWSQPTAPHRWLSLGAFKLYAAALVLPALLCACECWLLAGGRQRLFALGALALGACLLAAQPDASQALALLMGFVFLQGCRGFRSAASWVAAVALVAAATLAWMRPDPLQPVAHVEGVFALAWSHSPVAGVAVLLGALFWLAALPRTAKPGVRWPLAVAAYYAVLFVASALGATPAPLIGYGAGPVLGYGLLLLAAPGRGGAGQSWP